MANTGQRAARIAVTAWLWTTAWACAPSDGRDAAAAPDRSIGGKADEVSPAAACFDRLLDGSRGPDEIRGADLALRTDPIAQFVLKAEDEACPESFSELLALLRKTDAVGCADDPRAGVETMVVSETAQPLGRPDGFRTVTSRACSERDASHMLFSQIGPTADDALPRDVEIMAFDETRGMFNFYTLEAGQWTFFGTSLDLLQDDSASRCARCHTTGGPLMKEIDNPWLHWDGDATTPGAVELVAAHEDLGSHATGADLEQIVRDGNQEWLEIWITDLMERGEVKPLLEPLFCDVELNVGTATRAVGDDVRFVPARALVDDAFDTGPFPLQVSIDPLAYDAGIAAIGQRVQHLGKPIVGPDGEPIVDTTFKMPYPQRGRLDQAFVERLVQIDVLDRDFVLDVLSIDFTRPIGSRQRCALLDFSPTLPALLQPKNAALMASAVAEKFAPRIGNCCEEHPESGCTGAGVQSCVCAQDHFCCEDAWDALCVRKVTELGCAACPGREELFAAARVDVAPGIADDIRQGFIDNLQAADPDPESPAGLLLARLQDPGDAEDHRLRVSEFFGACNRRDPQPLVDDLLHVVSARRDAARNQPMFEFEATFPTDDLQADPLARLDPVTCELGSAPSP